MNEILTKTITEMLKSPLNSLVSEFGAEIKQLIGNRLLEYQAEEYNRNINVKTLLYRSEPVNLYRIYQPLYLGRESKSEKISTNTVKDIFAKSKFITIIGYAGSGKSMLIRHLFLDSVKSNFKYPIKVELRYLNDYPGNIVEFIKEKIFEFYQLGSSDRIIAQLLDSGKFIFFFDGYDEINSTIKAKVTNDVNEFVKLYNKNNFILTSRPFTGIESFPLFHNYWIQGFSNEEIEQFIHKQLGEEKELIEKIITAIKRPENSAYRSFLWNPLLLTMFIISFNTYAEIPQKRSMFYRQVFDTLYLIHDSSSKLAYVREKRSGLAKDQFEKILQAFCFLTFFEYKTTFSEDYLNEVLEKVKKNKLQITFDNSQVVDDLTTALCFLTKEGFEYSFLHKSLQEYFTAQYISTLSKENKVLIYEKITNKIFSDSGQINIEDYSNLYILLSEVDSKFLTTLLVLPILKDIKSYFTYSEIENLAKSGDLERIFMRDFWSLSMFFKSEINFKHIENAHLDTFNKLHDLNMSRIRNEISENEYIFSVNKIINDKVVPIMKNYVDYLSIKEDEYVKLHDSEEGGDFNILSMVN